MIGRRQRNRSDVPAPVATGGDGWLPADQRPAASVGSNTPPESWVPSDIGFVQEPGAATSSAVADPVEWLAAPMQAGETSNVDVSAVATSLAPEQWLVKDVASQSDADAAAAADVHAPPTRWIADAPTVRVPVAAAAAPTVGSDTRHAPLLRFGLPVVVVAVSLIVALAIAGVFSSAGGSRPAATRSGAAVHPAPPTASPAAVGPTPAKRPATGATPRRSRRQTARRPRSQHAASHSAPPTAAPRPVAPVTIPHRPVTVVPAPAHRTPVAPQHATPGHRLSQTRPTHRSGAPGRQPTSG